MILEAGKFKTISQVQGLQPCTIMPSLRGAGDQIRQVLYQLSYLPSQSAASQFFCFKMLCDSLVLCASDSHVDISNLLFRV